MLKTFFRFQPSYNILQVFKLIHIILLMIKPKQKEIYEKTKNNLLGGIVVVVVVAVTNSKEYY